MRNCILLSILCFFSVNSYGQSGDWLKKIERNAISKGKAGIFSAAKPGYALYFSQSGSVNEPYLVYVPKSYDPSRPSPLVVFLHGAILARDSFQYKDPEIADEPIFSIADAFNTIVLFPFGRSDFKWSGRSPAYENVIKMIRQAEECYNINKQRIYIGGISMGGIATFWFINNKPELFAGFYTFSAMPRLPDQAINFKAITIDKPLFSMNAKDDPGFSYTEVHEIYEQHKAEAKGWHFESVETGGHRFIYNSGGQEYVKSIVGSLLKSSR
jgi:predicted peptidase